MTKTVYGLFFEDSESNLYIFYVGCTNNVERRRREHEVRAFNAAHAEYDTYKYQFCRLLRQQGLEYRMEVLAPEAEISDRSDEYSWILLFADHNRRAGIEYYDGYPLTNMKAGDFLAEMLREPTVRTADQIRQYRQRRAQELREQKRQICYQRHSWGDQTRGQAQRKHVADSMVVIQQARSTEQTLAALQAQRRQQQREQQAAQRTAIWRQREQHWLATGEMWGIDYDQPKT